MQMMRMIDERGGVPRAVFKDPLNRGAADALRCTISALAWDDFRKLVDLNNWNASQEIAKVHPPDWQRGKAMLCLTTGLSEYYHCICAK